MLFKISFGILFALNIFAFCTISTILAADDLDDEGTVEDVDEFKKAAVQNAEKDVVEEESTPKVSASADVETSFLFVEPAIVGKDIPAATAIKFLVGFLNKGSSDFIVERMDVSFRYPMDFTFYIQNYTDAVFNRVVVPNTEATFEYNFIPSESYAGRPLGLSVNLRYSDTNKTEFISAVYNETVTLFEDESAFNPETGFLYIVFGCVAILLLVLGQQFLSKMRKKHGISKRPAPVEMGTMKNGDIDFDWIPKQLLQQNNKNSLTRRELRVENNNQTRKDR